MTNIFGIIAQYNMRVFQVSDIKGDYNDSEYVIARVLTCVASLLLCIIFVFITDFTSFQRIIIICYLFFRLSEAFVDVFHGIDQKNWRMDYVGISLAIRGVLMLAAFIVVLRFFDLLHAVIAMAAITWIIVVFYDVQKTKKLARYSTYAYKKIFSLLKRCFPLMLVTLCAIVIVSFTRYTLDEIYGTELHGIYASVTNPVVVVQVGISVLLAPIANLFATYLKDGNKAKFIKVFILTLAFIIAVTFVFAVLSHFFGGWGLGVLYNNDSKIIPYAFLLPGATAIAGLTASLWFMNVALTALRDIKGLLIGNIIGVIICVALANVLLNNYDLLGANFVMIISMSSALLCLCIRLFWFINKKHDLFAMQ